MMIPNVKLNQIIQIGEQYIGPKAQIVHIYSDEDRKNGIFGDIQVVYYQNKLKGIKDDVVWGGEKWKFKKDGPGGTYVDIDQYDPILKS